MKTQPTSSPKTPSAKTHRRSRTGCFTCRLRRKKCDEGKSMCRACKNLGLVCEYKRPQWWSNVEHRKQHKENIKIMIKRTKLNEKVSQVPSLAGLDSPPGLSHMHTPSDTSEMDLYRQRSNSVGSGYSIDGEVTVVDPEGYGQRFGMEPQEYFVGNVMQESAFHPSFQPLIDDKMAFGGIKQEPGCPSIQQPTALLTPPTDSYEFQPLPTLQQPQPQYPAVPTLIIPSSDPSDFNFFDFGSEYPTPPDSTVRLLDVPECDMYLFDHFVQKVLPLLFPVLSDDVRNTVILPTLSRNKCFYHCCLSISALHMKTAEGLPAEQIDGDIMRHRYQTVLELSEALARGTEHLDSLEATLGIILFQTTVGSVDDNLPDVAWHQHFQAAIELIARLRLDSCLTDLRSTAYDPAPLNMNLAAWIDILGSTMIARTPEFANTYREKLISGSVSGLLELMGCDDRILYLISETVCLEALIQDGLLTDIKICEHVQDLASKLECFEQEPLEGHTAVTSAVTDAFRLATRVYLTSLVPNFDRNDASVRDLLDRLTAALESVPQGYDRSLTWVYLMGASVATPGSRFRTLFATKKMEMGEEAGLGAWGRMSTIAEELWLRRDSGEEVSWRECMRGNGWDWLLI